MAQRDASPVYYREIQKHAYLKRMPDDNSGSKLRPLVLKKPPLKPMWTQLCIHNGRTPYLEQYKDPVSARAHRPAWRASLVTARHVTASVTPRDTECDFLIDTQEGPVRMLAPNWESMQEWVSTLRGKLRELRIVSVCENEYAAPPARPPPRAPRAAARDPASPLPPTPPLPPDRVPGIDLSSVVRVPSIPETPPDSITPEEPEHPEIPENPEVDISDWDEDILPSTSQAPTSVANICGQNICLDGSLLTRGNSDEEVTDPDRESDAGDQESDTTNVTVIAVTTKSDEVPSAPASPIPPSPGHLIHIGADETYGAVFEPAYEHLSRACSAVRLKVHDSTYEYLFPHNGTSEASHEENTERETTDRITPGERITAVERTTASERITPVDRIPVERMTPAERITPGERIVPDERITPGERIPVERTTPAERITPSERITPVERIASTEKLERSSPDATKPAWRRGLTELALLGRLRKRNDATSSDNNNSERVTSRSRETRPDTRRRRSSSLSNGVTLTPAAPMCERITNEPTLQPLRARQAAALVRTQRRGAACVGRIGPGETPIFADYDNQVWIARWGPSGTISGGRTGDRLCAVAGVTPVHIGHAIRLLATAKPPVDILFYRVPLAKIYVITKRDQQTLGITLDKECNIHRVAVRSPAEVAGLPPAGQWAVTEVNNRPLNLLKGGEEQMNRISLNGTEASLLLQPSALVRRLRAAIKASR